MYSRQHIGLPSQIYILFCQILSRQTFTHFFKSHSKKFATYMFKTRGGGGQRLFKQCLKKLHYWYGMASLSRQVLAEVEFHLSPFSFTV